MVLLARVTRLRCQLYRECENDDRARLHDVVAVRTIGACRPEVDVVRRCERRVDAAAPALRRIRGQGWQLERQRLPIRVEHGVQAERPCRLCQRERERVRVSPHPGD